MQPRTVDVGAGLLGDLVGAEATASLIHRRGNLCAAGCDLLLLGTGPGDDPADQQRHGHGQSPHGRLPRAAGMAVV
jgi:hypothetical protein